MVFDISMDVNKELQKCYEMCHLSAVEVKQKSETIDGKSYVVREERNAIVTYWIHGNVWMVHLVADTSKRQRGRVRDALPALQVM